VLNEVMAYPSLVDYDGSGSVDYMDAWIEFYNGYATEQDISSWYVTCSTCSPVTYTLPMSTTIQARAPLLLLSRISKLDFVENVTTTLTLYNSSDTLIDSHIWYTNTADYSWGRYPDGSTWRETEFWYPTMGLANTSATPTPTATP